jgi:SARP family transcriptional regulator, regulator of embCAB operon
MIVISVFGEFEARYDDRVLPLQPKQRELIQALLCMGEMVSRDRVVELLWGQLSDSRIQTLHTHLSRIDRAVTSAGGDAHKFIVRTPLGERRSGYRLGEGTDIDADRFQELVVSGTEAFRHGDYDTADQELARALSMRDNQALLPQVAHRPFALGYLTRLEESYRACTVTYFKVCIALGRSREAVGRLAASIDRWPEERELSGLLVHALYRCNRITEASEVCRETSETLRAQGMNDQAWRDLQSHVLRGTLAPIAA